MYRGGLGKGSEEDCFNPHTNLVGEEDKNKNSIDTP
jgi:hypothetical protein